MLERFTPPALHAVAVASALADELDRPAVAVDDLLAGLLSIPSSAAARVLVEHGVTLKMLTGREADYTVFNVITPAPKDVSSKHLAPPTVETVRRAVELAECMGHTFAGTEHVLVAALERPDVRAVSELHQKGLTADAARAQFFGR